MSKCIVFVCNKQYFNKFIYTCSQLITTGKYTGDICLVIGNDLCNDPLLNCKFIQNNGNGNVNIFIKHFPDIEFSNDFTQINNNINTDGRNLTKQFQWHKMHLFNIFFKQWDYIFYLDCGITIFAEISPMLNTCTKNTLLAHSDAFPTYEWKLHTQFDKCNTNIFTKLNNTYNLHVDYFQTTIMLYDTNIIDNNTYTDLINLTLKYPISKTNEQGIMALYFTNIKPCFTQIPTHNENIHYYDYLSRNKKYNYIMLKSC
uniref:Nucleotide-diphospho-sugar transferase domain-containing protein n=1 Tax=viral metagenome TaxID=1070528 RepID=A0A6C0HL94_9ZZZZ